MLKWLRRLFRTTEPTAIEWYVVADGAPIAVLRAPRYVEMFWRSFEIQHLTEPADRRLDEDAFWMGESWHLIDARTRLSVGQVIVASVGVERDQHRITLRGPYAHRSGEGAKHRQ